MRQNRPEDAIQIEVAALLDLLELPWFHVPNERQCSPITGAILKRKGVRAGVPDVIIPRAHVVVVPGAAGEPAANLIRHGLAIELKSPGNYPTPEQRAWLARFEAESWSTAVCRSLSQVVDVLESCDLLRHPRSGRPLDLHNAKLGYVTEAKT